MSEMFLLPGGTLGGQSSNPFEPLGLASNPFPEPGLDSGVLYTKHLEEEFNQLNGWLAELQAPGAKRFRPIAVRGALGVGKTHLLHYIHRGLESAGSPVVQRNLTETGMTRLLLANLLLDALPTGPELVLDEDEEAINPPILEHIVGALLSGGGPAKLIASEMERLGSESPIVTPLRTIAGSQDPWRLATWMGRWLTRGFTTPIQRAKLGVAKPLSGEGAALRAIGDTLRLAKALELVPIWFVFIDQMEELWRPHVVTPVQKARFLTDLRFLVDRSLEGSPIAIMLAWNTDISVASVTEDDPVAQKLQAEYLALWQRLGSPVEIPGLVEEHVWPFARVYLRNAPKLDGEEAEKARKDYYTALKERGTPAVLKALRTSPYRLGLGRYAPRGVLACWKRIAEEIARDWGDT